MAKIFCKISLFRRNYYNQGMGEYQDIRCPEPTSMSLYYQLICLNASIKIVLRS